MNYELDNIRNKIRITVYNAQLTDFVAYKTTQNYPHKI